ncbi:hypothetical protein UlMin_020402 [Ulmus minor]
MAQLSVTLTSSFLCSCPATLLRYCQKHLDLIDRLEPGLLLHSAGHLLDICMKNVGLSHLEPRKGYHFPDGPFVEYKGLVLHNELQTKQKELEQEINGLVSRVGKVTVDVLPYEEATEMCGSCLPDYIAKENTPCIVKFGNYPGCPCGGTHVYDISEIISVIVSQIRMKKGVTKVFYNVGK